MKKESQNQPLWVYTQFPSGPLYKNGMQHHGKEIFLTKRWRTRQRSTQFHEESKIDYRRFASEPTPIFFLAGIRTCYCKYWKKYDLPKKNEHQHIWCFCLTPSAIFGSHKNGKKPQNFPRWRDSHGRAVGWKLDLGKSSWKSKHRQEVSGGVGMDGWDMIGSLEDGMLVDGSGSKWLFS